MKKKNLTVIIDLNEIITILAALVIYVGIATVGIGCPVRWITGISCAGCGMTRAWLSFFKGDFGQAFHFHPLFFMPPIALLAYFFRSIFPKRVQKLLLYAFIVLFVAVYLARLFDPEDTIVTANPLTESLPARIVGMCAAVF